MAGDTTAAAAPPSGRSFSRRRDNSFSVAKTLKSNRGHDDLTTSSKGTERTYLTRSKTKRRRICDEGEKTDLLISGDLHSNSNQGVCSEISDEVALNLSKSVVSLFLSNDHTKLFYCSGVVVYRVGCATRILTSARLVKALNDNRKDHDNLKVEVGYEDKIVTGFLGEYDLDLNVAAVNVENFPDLHAIPFKKMSEKPLPHKVVAAGRDIFGKWAFTSGRWNVVDSSVSVYSEELMFSTCKIPEVWEGGPLCDFDGDFVGINLSLGTEGTFFLPMVRVLGWLGRCTSLRGLKFPARSKPARVGERLTVRNKDQFGDLESLGYPEPPTSMSNDGMLVNGFEEPFGDICGKGVWSELSETVASNIRENTVALASFSEGKRFFACTGCFIEWNGCTTILTSASLLRTSGYENKIVENLRIEVLLHNKQHVEGTLQHYNLHYNVALVSVKEDFCASQPAKIQHRWRDSCELLAVGCSFISGNIMAARGRQFAMMVTREHCCRFLGFSTCRITKAGIGGPLLDFGGKFVGMNFYDEEVGGTPYLSWCEIHKVLEYFKTKRTVAEVGHVDYPSSVLDWTIPGDTSVLPNRWPVPTPYWCHPDDLDKHEYQIQIRRRHIIFV